MGLNDKEMLNNTAHIDKLSTYSFFNFINKPIEIYLFINFLCPKYQEMMPFFKKLSIEYGHLFSIKPIISKNLQPFATLPTKTRHVNKTCEMPVKKTSRSHCNAYHDSPSSSTWTVPLAVKAAELQGKRAGKKFLQHIQEYLFLNRETNFIDEKILIECAQQIELDVDEFKQDLYSTSAKKALHDDLQLLKEMEVRETPTLVFFNHLTNDPGIKISGLYSYDIYVQVLYDALHQRVTPAQKPPLEDLLAYYRVIDCQEVAMIYDWSLAKAKRELKKLQLKQQVKEVSAKYGSFWQYVKTE